jgi:Invasion associated locus B (IalB) protein
MIFRGAKPLAAALAAMFLAGIAPGLAQTEGERVASYTDWSVFTPSGDPRECYIVSPPAATTARRGGETVQVNRGDIRLFVTFRPGEGVRNEVSFTGGYPFRAGSTVEVEVGSESFDLAIGTGEASEWAWPSSPAEDERLIAAFRRGADAQISGTSERGTTTVDTFSLMGFSAALEDAAGRCG